MTTKTDIELLTISALAAGLRIEGTGEFNLYVSGHCRMNSLWNPLESISNAFELAAFTGLCVDFEDAEAIYRNRDVWIGSDKEMLHLQKICRVIVLAAVAQYEERKAEEAKNPPSEYD